eukprot:scaffold1483_cov379-Prasinococcus_capsulatus_cf.AAC.10
MAIVTLSTAQPRTAATVAPMSTYQPNAGSRVVPSTSRTASFPVRFSRNRASSAARVVVSCSADKKRVVIAGAPASGKGTQCEKIVEKVRDGSRLGIVLRSAACTGDLLRAAVKEETEAGLKAKEFMDAGKLVPEEIVVTMVLDRLRQPDCQERGWLLDGYPRSGSQAKALEDAGIRPQVFLQVNVPDEKLVDRVVGRRMDPETGKIYHLTFSPPETEEIAARLVQRSDDNEEKCRVRLQVFHENNAAVETVYSDILKQVSMPAKQLPDRSHYDTVSLGRVVGQINGDQSKDAVFGEIDGVLAEL